jgi:uncharacterized membrane protein
MAGGTLAVALMLIGLATLEIRAARTAHPLDIAHVVENRAAGRAVDVFVSLDEVTRALARWPPEPLGIIAAGIVMLLATPGVALVAAFTVFGRTADRQYATICAILVLELLFGFLFKLGG